MLSDMVHDERGSFTSEHTTFTHQDGTYQQVYNSMVRCISSVLELEIAAVLPTDLERCFELQLLQVVNDKLLMFLPHRLQFEIVLTD